MDPITKALLTEFVADNGMLSLDEDEQFERFAAFSVLSSRYADDFDTEDLIAGGGQDLGIDAFAVIVNGRLVEDAQGVDDLLALNGYLDVEFVIVQAKRSAKFEGAAFMALGDNIANTVFGSEIGLPVNDEIVRLLAIRERVYANAARLKENPELRIFFVTTGNWTDDAYLKTIITRKETELSQTNLFKTVKFNPIGASELQQFYRDTKTSITRVISFSKYVVMPTIKNVAASYLGALPALEYIKLITDADGNILKSVFIDNVRDFQGENPVNQDIATTIKSESIDQFVLRNNGVTIVAREILTTGDKFTLKDYQIVNGCQTSHVLFNERERLDQNLLVPIKLIYTDDEEVTQQVIKSTNRQTPIDENDLLALTQFQRNLEDYYKGFPEPQRLLYERRSKQYATRTGIEKARIIPVGVQLKCFAAMFLDLPHQAGRYQATLLATVKDRVFKHDHKPEPYYTSALTFFKFDALLKRADDSRLRSFKYSFLNAFRYRYEAGDVPGLSNGKWVATAPY